MVTLTSSAVPTVESPPSYQPLADPPTETDEQLMLQVQQRSLVALETLYERYAELGLGLACRILGDRDRADQVLSAAFWHLWGHPYQSHWVHGRFPDLFSGIIWHLALDELDRQWLPPLRQTGNSTERLLTQH